MRTYDARAAVGDRENLDLESRRDVHRATRTELPAGTHHRFPLAVPDLAQEQDLGVGARCAPAEQARSKYPARVEDERVTRRDEVGQVAKAAMLDRTALAPYDEQPAVVTSRERLLRDTIGGEREVVVARPRSALVGDRYSSPTR